MKMALQPETAIEREVAQWVKETAADDYDGEVVDVFDDLFRGGCASGMVSDMIYYSDTLDFFARHFAEINDRVRSWTEDMGEPVSLWLRGWDDSDPLAAGTNNKNLLAWFGFEDAARDLAMREGYQG